jgi:MoaA/NifB/PqqE/SkfB family radical SAM enzyme
VNQPTREVVGHQFEVSERGEHAAAPEELYLEVTNRCNLRCTTCPQYFGMEERFHTLTWERFIEITDQFSRLRRVVLHGIGEPLLNPHLGRMVRHLKARGAYVLFNTNGLLLRGKKARDLAESGLDELRVSIDGGTPQTYQAVRGIDGFNRILGNLRRFEDHKAEVAATTPRVSLWVTLMKTTVVDLPDLVRLAAAHNVRETCGLVRRQGRAKTSLAAAWFRPFRHEHHRALRVLAHGYPAGRYHSRGAS